MSASVPKDSPCFNYPFSSLVKPELQKEASLLNTSSFNVISCSACPQINTLPSPLVLRRPFGREEQVEPLTYTGNSLFLELTCFLPCLLCWNVPAQLNEYVAKGLTDSIHRYHSDNSTKAAWDSIQSFVSTSGILFRSAQTSCSSLKPWGLVPFSGSLRI